MAESKTPSGKNPAAKPGDGEGPPAKKPGMTRKVPPSGKGGPPRKPPAEVEAPEPEPEEPEESAEERKEKHSSSGRRKAAHPPRKAEEKPSRESAAAKQFFKPEGMPLAVKFVVAISGMVFALMVGFSLAIYLVSTASLDESVADSGVSMLKSVDVIARAYLEELEYRKRRGEDERILQAVRERYRSYMGDLLKLTTGDREAKTGVLNAMIKAPGETLYAEGTNIATKKTSAAKKYQLRGKDTDILYYDGVYQGEVDKKSTEMMMFEKEIQGRPGKVQVVVSASVAARARSQLLLRIILATVVSILIGVGVSFILASQVSNPIKKLLEDISTVSAGRLDHKTAPVTKDEIGVLARAFDAMTQNLKIARDREIENQAREHDLKIAAEIQANLLPSKIPVLQGYDLDAYYRPSKEVGGDYYDYIQIDETHVGMIVADVSGKGIPGSMVMTMARSLLRMEAERNFSAADTLKKVNKIIARDIRRGMFVTALYMILDIPSRKILVSSAGHNPLAVYRASTKKVELVNPNGIALGFDKGPIFDRTVKEEEVALQRGDRIVMYTDGVVESMNAEHEEFTDKRFFGIVEKVGERNSNQFINILVTELDKHQGDAEQHDDITVSTFRVV
jgi:serine phosphatase RsbU (regulator of sigma subunit)